MVKFVKYVNKEFAFEISYPDYWEVNESDPFTAVVFWAPLETMKDKYKESLKIVCFQNSEDKPSDYLVTFSSKMVEEALSDEDSTQIIEPLSDALLSGFPAKQFSYMRQVNKLNIYTYRIWTIYNNSDYHILWFSEMRDKDRYKPYFNKMIRSFKISF
ncbi:MAG: hypothetical protein GF383_12325 [Candidatus Lokiarchaeota archaeon]|nr:hypothetical protein [Candidatus Lokiarchaeota archaeon]MBD3341786.1 hypothetical protein [Candidatus Lokiarchaeota archaeon]